VAVAALVLGVAGGLARAQGAAPARDPHLGPAAEALARGDLAGAVQRLAALADGREPGARAQLLLGYALLRLGRPAEAIPPLDQAAANHATLGDYALAWLAEAQREARRPEAAAATIARLLERHPDSLLAERASRELGQVLADLGRLAEAELAYAAHLARFPTAASRPEAMLALAEILLRSGRPREAEPLLRGLWVEWPMRREARAARELLDRLPAAAPLSKEEILARGSALYRANQFQQAWQELGVLLGEPGALGARARYTAGVSAFHARDYAGAARVLLPLVSRGGPSADEALYWLGRSYARGGNPEDATQAYRRLVATYPRSPWADQAFYYAGLLHEDQGRPDEAAKAYGRLIREYPRSEWADVAHWRTGWLRYRAGDLDGAARTFRALAAGYPHSSLRPQATYWEARARHRQGETAEAVRLLRGLAGSFDGYYSRRAREALAGLRLPAPDPGGPPGGPEAPAGAPRESRHLAAARELDLLGLREEAGEELWWLVGAEPDDRGLLAEAAGFFADRGQFERLLTLAKRLLRPLYLQDSTQLPVARYWEFLYPRGHWEVVRDRAGRYRLDPYLVLAVIREESAFAPRAVSRAGARGLMQLMPRTADVVARAHPVGQPLPDGLDSPEVNIALGSAHLAQLLQEFRGEWTHAIASYNAGAQAVRRWLEAQRGKPIDEFVEEIPFTETRLYVKRVLGSYERYVALYAAREARPR
jgi:soluble lytic murein transglycosylase